MDSASLRDSSPSSRQETRSSRRRWVSSWLAGFELQRVCARLRLVGDIGGASPRRAFHCRAGGADACRRGAPPGTPLGDLGLLAPRVFGTSARVPHIGLIPHLSHRGSEWVERLRADNRIEVIDVRRSPHTVCRQIGACMAIITSSLHGLIVADAYGVPAVWGLPTPILLGSDHKFRDHHTAIGLDPSDRFVDLETTTVDDALDRALTALRL